MLLSTHVAPPFYKNGFLVGCEETREAVVLDPGDEIEEVVRAAASGRLEVKFILLTHAHLDHVTGVGRAKDAFGAPVYLHRGRCRLYEHVGGAGCDVRVRVEPQPPVDPLLHAGRGHPLRRLRGAGAPHAGPLLPAASACRSAATALTGRDLFVGDTLFAGSIGRTDLPGGDHAHARRARSPRCCSRSVTTPACIPGTASRRRSGGSGGPIRSCGNRREAGRRALRSARPSISTPAHPQPVSGPPGRAARRAGRSRRCRSCCWRSTTSRSPTSVADSRQ